MKKRDMKEYITNYLEQNELDYRTFLDICSAIESENVKEKDIITEILKKEYENSSISKEGKELIINNLNNSSVAEKILNLDSNFTKGLKQYIAEIELKDYKKEQYEYLDKYTTYHLPNIKKFKGAMDILAKAYDNIQKAKTKEKVNSVIKNYYEKLLDRYYDLDKEEIKKGIIRSYDKGLYSNPIAIENTIIDNLDVKETEEVKVSDNDENIRKFNSLYEKSLNAENEQVIDEIIEESKTEDIVNSDVIELPASEDNSKIIEEPKEEKIISIPEFIINKNKTVKNIQEKSNDIEVLDFEPTNEDIEEIIEESKTENSTKDEVGPTLPMFIIEKSTKAKANKTLPENEDTIDTIEFEETVESNETKDNMSKVDEGEIVDDDKTVRNHVDNIYTPNPESEAGKNQEKNNKIIKAIKKIGLIAAIAAGIVGAIHTTKNCAGCAGTAKTKDSKDKVEESVESETTTVYESDGYIYKDEQPEIVRKKAAKIDVNNQLSVTTRAIAIFQNLQEKYSMDELKTMFSADTEMGVFESIIESIQMLNYDNFTTENKEYYLSKYDTKEEKSEAWDKALDNSGNLLNIYDSDILMNKDKDIESKELYATEDQLKEMLNKVVYDHIDISEFDKFKTENGYDIIKINKYAYDMSREDINRKEYWQKMGIEFGVEKLHQNNIGPNASTQENLAVYAINVKNDDILLERIHDEIDYGVLSHEIIDKGKNGMICTQAYRDCLYVNGEYTNPCTTLIKDIMIERSMGKARTR